MFQRLRPSISCGVLLLSAVAAGAWTVAPALAQSPGLAAALPAGAAFAAPAIAVLAGFALWRAVRLLGLALTGLIGAATAILVMMAAEGRLDLEPLLAPILELLGARA